MMMSKEASPKIKNKKKKMRTRGNVNVNDYVSVSLNWSSYLNFETTLRSLIKYYLYT